MTSCLSSICIKDGKCGNCAVHYLCALMQVFSICQTGSDLGNKYMPERGTSGYSWMINSISCTAAMETYFVFDYGHVFVLGENGWKVIFTPVYFFSQVSRQTSSWNAVDVQLCYFPYNVVYSFRLYPIDKSRVNEYGQVFEETDNAQTENPHLESRKDKWSRECCWDMLYSA